MAAHRNEGEIFGMGIFYKMGDLGLTGLPWEESYGGAGFDFPVM